MYPLCEMILFLFGLALYKLFICLYFLCSKHIISVYSGNMFFGII